MNFKKLYQKYSFKNLDGETAGLITLSQNQINDLHKVLVRIVDDIMRVCSENNLVCFLGGGSALGAIRHNGFIPWDDDIDLNITRESYNKFIPAFREKYGDKYWIQTPEDTPQFGMPICRIRKKGTKVVTKEDLIDITQAGAFVDLFIIENTYNNKFRRIVHGALCIIVKACASCRRFYRDKQMIQDVGMSSGQQNVFRSRMVIGFLTSFMSVERWTKFMNSIFSLCKDNTTKFVTIPAGRWHFFGELYDRKIYCELGTLPFEGRKYPVSVDIKNYMVRLYGKDYMQVPPEDKREKHVCWEFDLGDEK